MKPSPLAEKAFDYLCKNNPFDPTVMDQSSFVMMLMDFHKTHGDDAIIALAGAHVYATNSFKYEEVKRNRFIKIVFCHDLNGRNDKTMLPRSSDYKEFFINHQNSETISA